MKPYILVSLMCSFILSLSLVSASIEGTIREIKSDDKPINLENVEIKFYFTNGLILGDITNKLGHYTVDPGNIYCWDGCNIFPDIGLLRVEMKQDSDLISQLTTKLHNNLPEVKSNVTFIHDIFTGGSLFEKEIKPSFGNIFNNWNTTFDENLEGDYHVLWNGTLLIDNAGVYIFETNANQYILWIDDVLVNGSIELEEGFHNLMIEYTISEELKPNLFWAYNGSSMEVLLKTNLLFNNGGSRYIEEPPAVALSSITSQDIDFSVYPTLSYVTSYPIIESARPLVLIHGLHGKFPYWKQIPIILTNKGYQVWQIYYSPANLSNYLTAGLLKDGLDSILSLHPLFPDDNVDLISHSMGGLVSLGYIHNMGFNQQEQLVFYQNNIRKYIMIAAPIFGSYQSNLVLEDYNWPIICYIVDWFKPLIPDKTEPALQDLQVGSLFSMDLYDRLLNQDIEYLTIAGIQIFAICGNNKGMPNDGLVDIFSSSLLEWNYPHIILFKTHDNLRGRTILGIPDNTADLIGIIDSFIQDKSTNTIKSFLGFTEKYIDFDDPNSDENPYGAGAIFLFFSGLNPSFVSLNSPQGNFFMTRNPRTNVWYYIDFNFLFAHHQFFNTAIPSGTYSIIADSIDYGTIRLNPLQTNVVIIVPTCSQQGGYICLENEICNGNLLNASDTDRCCSITCTSICIDNDGDGYGENCNLGFDCDDSDPSINPAAIEICDGLDNDCDGEIDENVCIPTVQIVTPVNGSTVNESNILVNFDTSNWDVSGKGQTHIHFHIDNIPGLSFSDHLMFYNAPDNLVELNTQSGTTSFATWINSNTLQINNVPEGNYNLRAHLSTTGHSPPGNPEADTTIQFFVDLPEPFIQLIVYSPEQNKIYNTRRIPFNLTTNIEVDEITYMDLLARRPRERRLCRNCDEYGNSRKRTKNLREGNHSITFKANPEVNVDFFIDSKDPRIRKTLPRRNKYSNGSFIIEWQEDNMAQINLHYGAQVLGRTDCPFDPGERKQICEFNVDLTNFDGRTLKYWFEIIDIADNEAKSRTTSFNVDTTSPEITKLNFTINRRRVEFDVEVSEEVKLEYFDENARRSRWRIFCRNCDSYDRRKSFRSGEHNLLIRAMDKASNSDVREINFEI